MPWIALTPNFIKFHIKYRVHLQAMLLGLLGVLGKFVSFIVGKVVVHADLGCFQSCGGVGTFRFELRREVKSGYKNILDFSSGKCFLCKRFLILVQGLQTLQECRRSGSTYPEDVGHRPDFRPRCHPTWLSSLQMSHVGLWR